MHSNIMQVTFNRHNTVEKIYDIEQTLTWESIPR